jgi:hypothetical protein
MVRSAIAIVLSVYFLLGSTLLPKGDFSLMADLPNMYEQYKAIDDPQDISILDFVSDYLLNGEAIFKTDVYNGHNIPYNTVQFAHQAKTISCILLAFSLPAVSIQIIHNLYVLKNDNAYIYLCCNEVFRPPLF